MARESKEVPGFYEIDGFSNYLISKKAEIYSRKLKRLMSTTRIPAGYRYVCLIDDDGFRHTLTRHRIMAKVFLKCPGNPSDYQVNHIDGVPGHDILGNLEWVTPQENQEHALANNIHMGPKIPVEVRDCVSGKVTQYPSVSACAKGEGISKDTVRSRLYHPRAEGCIWPELKQYRAPSDNPWYIPKNLKLEALLNSKTLPVSVRNVLTGEVEEFTSSTEAAEALGVKVSTLSTWLDFSDQPIFPGMVQVKSLFDKTPWRDVKDPYLEMDQTRLRRCAVVIWPDTGVKKIYTMLTECAKDLDISPTNLAYRLNHMAGRVFKLERYILFYYSDYVKSKFYEPN